MTLVVAKVAGTSAHVVSDTKLTNELTKAPIPITEGIIKTKIITPAIAVSFAGNSHVAQAGVRVLRPTMSATEMAESLLEFHRSADADNSAEFLVTTVKPHAFLIEIKNGNMSEGLNGWIGSYEAYRSYRALEMGHMPADPAIPGHQDLGQGPAGSFSEMTSAMKHLIADPNYQDVGGFAVAVSGGTSELNYMGYANVFFPPMMLPPGEHVLPFGTAAQGGYAYEIVPTNDKQGVSSYFLQGRFGILYWPLERGLPEANMFTNVDPFEFIDIASEKAGCPVSTFHADVRILSSRGHQKLRNGDSAGALKDADRAIAASDGREGWILKGEVKAVLGDETGAVAAFEEAARKVPTDPNGWNKLGLAFMRLEAGDRAVDAFSNAIRADSSFWRAYANRANHLFHSGRVEEALLDITKACELAPEDAGLWKKKAAVLQRLGRSQEACEAARMALTIAPGDAELVKFVSEQE